MKTQIISTYFKYKFNILSGPIKKLVNIYLFLPVLYVVQILIMCTQNLVMWAKLTHLLKLIPGTCNISTNIYKCFSEEVLFL